MKQESGGDFVATHEEMRETKRKKTDQAELSVGREQKKKKGFDRSDQGWKPLLATHVVQAGDIIRHQSSKKDARVNLEISRTMAKLRKVIRSG